MKKTLFLVFCLTVSCQLLFAQKALYVSSSNGLNLREGPGTGHKIVINIPNGFKVEVLDSQGDWIKVRYNGKAGYVSKQFMSDEKPRTSGNSSSSNQFNNASQSGNKISRLVVLLTRAIGRGDWAFD